MPCSGNDIINFMSGQLAPFARLCSLCDLDLYLIGVDKILCCHTKPPAGNLLYGAPGTGTILPWFETERIFTAFTGIASSSYPVHSQGKRFMSLQADSTIRHGSGNKPLHYIFSRLNFLNRNGVLFPF